MTSAFAPLVVCAVVLLLLLWLLRRDRASLGLPVAYMLALMFIHVPGAYASVASQGIYGGRATEDGIRITALGAIAFFGGVWAVRTWMTRRAEGQRPARARSAPLAYRPYKPGPRFWMFCLLGGWFMIYGVALAVRIPSLGAAIDKGGAVWMLGAMLGLAHAFMRKDVAQAAFWGGAAFVYPVIMLLIGGFASYGSTAIIVVLAILTIVARNYLRMVSVLGAAIFVNISLFVNYFAARNDLRAAVWGGASMDARLAVIGSAFKNFAWFSAQNPSHLDALDKRLNQNYFIGVSMERLQLGHVDFLFGRSIWDGFIALIPRVLWPNKPVQGGSGSIVRDMTGLRLNADTSWGVGNVMEFYVNFGWLGVVGGFLILGALIGFLDRKTADSLRIGDLGGAFVFFLPCIALIQPNGSIVELSSGAAAALAAGFFWRWAWRTWSVRGQPAVAPLAARRP
jgi:hypothetical protein